MVACSYTLSVYNMQLRNIGRAKYIVCPTNPTVGIGQLPYILAHYVPAPLSISKLSEKNDAEAVFNLGCKPVCRPIYN